MNISRRRGAIAFFITLGALIELVVEVIHVQYVKHCKRNKVASNFAKIWLSRFKAAPVGL